VHTDVLLLLYGAMDCSYNGALQIAHCIVLYLLLVCPTGRRIVDLFKALYTDTLIQSAVSVLMDVSLSGFRSIVKFVRAVLLLPMCFWSQWTGS